MKGFICTVLDEALILLPNLVEEYT